MMAKNIFREAMEDKGVWGLKVFSVEVTSVGFERVFR